MSDYEVGRGKPPKHTRFGPGNQAAKGRRKAKPQMPSRRQLLEDVLNDSYTIKKDGRLVALPGRELLKQRFKQMLISPNNKDFLTLLQMVREEGLLGGTLADEALQVTYHMAGSSDIELPSPDLWDVKP